MRIAPEYAFDSSRGDLFVCRVVCNFVNADNLASFEFAVDALKFPLLLVLRHEACGAIKATMSSVQDGVARPDHLPSLVAALAPAVIDEPGDLLVKATRENVRRNVEFPEDRNADSQCPVDEGRWKVIGEIYRLATGQVELIG